MPRPDLPSHRCPSTGVLDLVSHKWTVTILYHLNRQRGPTRFRQLQRDVGEITQKELTKRLREMERSGLVAREVFAVVPPRVEYRLTELGESLIPALRGLHDWAEGHSTAVLDHQRRFDEARAASNPSAR